MSEVIVTGASSQVGCALLPPLATDSRSRILAVSRHPAPAWHRPSRSITWLDPTELESGWSGAEEQTLMSAGPLPLCVDLLERMPNPTRVVALSTASLITKTGPLDPGEASQLSGIREAEGQLQHYCQQRQIPCLILRPTMIWGKGLDRNVMRLAGWIRRWPLVPVFDGGQGLRQPLHADDLALVMMRSAQTTLEGLEPVAGGETLSLRTMIQRIAATLDHRRLVIPIPTGVGRAVLNLGHLVGGFQGLNASMLQRQGQDLLVDDSRIREALDYQPRGFRPERSELEPPDQNPQDLRLR